MIKTDKIEVRTRGNSHVVDITESVAAVVRRAGVRDGIVTLFNVGSTAGITTTEYEPGLAEKDLADAKLQLDAARDQLTLLEQAITALRQIRAGIPASPGPGLPEAEFKRLLSLVREFSPELADYIETYYDPSDPDMLD